MQNCNLPTDPFRCRRALSLGAIVLCTASALFLAAPMTAQSGEPAAEPAKPAPAQPHAITPADLQAQANAVLGLTSSQLVTLNVDPTPERPLSTALPLNGEVFTLQLSPFSNRAANYQVLAQVEDGSLVAVEPGPLRTLRGTLTELPGSAASASLLEDGLHASVRLPDGNKYWVEPLLNRVPGAEANQYVLYHEDDVIGQPGQCGLNDANMVGEFELDGGEGADEGGDEGGIAGGNVYCTDLGCDADFEYYQDHGSSVTNVQNQINAVINAVNDQYEAEVDIRHVITTIIVRTTAADPYSSLDPSTLLNQFEAEWNANQDAVVRDVAHLFTGKNLSGGVIGIANLGVICNLGSAYSLVESDCCGSLACASDLSSHELGHNWNASHCTCASNTMNPSLVCANVHAASSISQIIAFRNTRPCLDFCEDGTTTLPFFDDFPTTTINPAKWTGIEGATSNANATAEPSPPNSVNLAGSAAGGNELRSARMNSTGLANFTLEYYYSRRGGVSNDSPETGDDLIVEYFNASNAWTQISSQPGSGADMTTFSQVIVPLPAAALHDDFRVRFRAVSTTAGSDDWFIDNVSVTGVIPPTNETCLGGLNIAPGSYPFSTLGATTDGPDEPTSCNEGYSQIGSDVWFKYFSQCSDTVTVSVCGASFDTKIAVYASCPTGSGQAIACNDDACGNASSVSFQAQNLVLYRIRVGGFNDAEGTGTLVLSCDSTTGACCIPDGSCQSTLTLGECTAMSGTYQGNGTNCAGANCPQPTGACCMPNGSCSSLTQAACTSAGGTYQGNGVACTGQCPSACPADINGDGNVNIDDLFTVIADFGPCGVCDGDIDGDGDADIDDLFGVIAAWGPCP